MLHKLKILPKWFEDVIAGRKQFEIRKNDRNFQVGDEMLLQEWEDGHYTGREILKTIGYIYCGDGAFGLSEGYCILGMEPSKKLIRCEKCEYRINDEESAFNNCCLIHRDLHGFPMEKGPDDFCSKGKRRKTNE